MTGSSELAGAVQCRSRVSETSIVKSDTILIEFQVASQSHC